MKILQALLVVLTTGAAGVVASGYRCYGDMMLLSPTGASNITAHGEHLPYIGVRASQTIVEHDLSWLDANKTCYYMVGAKYCLQPALIAAIGSRESHGGRALVKTNGWGDCRLGKPCRAYGILQCDIYSSGLGRQGCLSHPWNSCEHIQMMVNKEITLKIKAVQLKFPNWLPKRQLQGQAYLFLTEQLASRTTATRSGPLISYRTTGFQTDSYKVRPTYF